MLVLMRHVGEQIVIGDDIVVTVTRAAGDKIWVGVDAPREVCVDRLEVRRRRLQDGRTEESGPAPEPEPGA